MTTSHRVALAFLLACSVLIGCAASSLPGFDSLSPAMVVSVSADGRYAVSSHREKELVLWDIQQRTYKLISDNANIYSAYFIQGRNAFLWQDLEDVVRVQTLDGSLLQSFEHFPTYGHVMGPKLETYVASDEGWGIHIGKGPEAAAIKATDARAFLGFGKLLNLTLDARRGLLLSAGYGYNFDDKYTLAEERARGNYLNVNGVALWDLDTRQPRHKLPGNAAKTHATLSPDGRFVIAVDENGKSFLWGTHDGRLITRLSRLGSGIYIGGHEPGSPKNRDTSGMRLHYPEDFPEGFSGGPQLGVHFISDTAYVVIFTDHPYAVLYEIGDPFAHKILPLDENPFPAVSSYSRNAAIDSAPAARVLVTGQRSGGGINVYRFDPQAQTLERVWAPRP